MKITLLVLILFVPDKILTDKLPPSVVSGAVHETIQTTSNYTEKSSVEEKTIVPSIVVVHTATGNQSSTQIITTTVQVPTTLATLHATIRSTDDTSSNNTVSATAHYDVTTQNGDVKNDVSSFQPTSSHVESEETVEVANEFPMPEQPRNEINSSESIRIRSTVAESLNTSTHKATDIANMTSFPVTFHSDNSTLPPGFTFLRELVQLVTYIRENSDRVLVVVLGSVCVGLFLTVCMLIFRCDESQNSCNATKRTSDANQEAECASLLGGPGASRRSRAEFSSSAAGNLYGTHTSQSNSNRRDNHIEYINHVSNQRRRRKQRSRTKTLLNRWCSCCCTNAPWQRDQSDSEDSYQIAHRSTSLSDDDIISAVPSGRNHFDVEVIPAFPTSLQEDSPSNVHSQGVASSNEMRIDGDNTSEYEYQDNDFTAVSIADHSVAVRPTTLHNSFRVMPAQIQHDQQLFTNGSIAVPIPINPATYNQPHMRHTYNQPKPGREPPPFPKPVNYGYQQRQHRSIPHYATQRISYNQPYQPQRTNHNQMVQPSTQQRQQQGYFPSFGDHYVSLRPQHHQPANARTLNLEQQNRRLQHRDSFYDNSLPRDSPLYEYYQRQQNRQELPGTRNINQYYT